MGPRPDVPGYADKLEGEQIADFVSRARSSADKDGFGFALPEGYARLSDQDLAVWYNDNVIYPDKVRLNRYYYEHYFGNGLRGLIGLKGFVKDIEMIFATVLSRKVMFGGEEI